MTRLTAAQFAALLDRNPDIGAVEQSRWQPAPPAQVGRGPLASRFEALWSHLGGPRLAPEYRFHPVRRWRFDYALPALQVAIELEGGIYAAGRHVRPLGFMRDAEKYNQAAAAGWLLFRLPTGMVNEANVGMILECVHRRLHPSVPVDGGEAHDAAT